ncbi:MAG: lauroyl acyltransferase, partial [Marivirga sp.]|nr:lauroyl acyltransferase [Marivirga sp.]
LRMVLISLPAAAIVWIVFGKSHNLKAIFSTVDLLHPILILGAIGQLMLNLRFVYQWYYSEKHKTSILPLGFWIISACASVMILIYASYRIDPVLLVAQGMGIFVYLRNIFIHYKTVEAI